MSIETHVKLAQETERLGFEFAMLADHLLAAGHGPQTSYLEAWSTLAALGALTKKIRLGTLVTCVPYRNPAVLAKMASNVDNLSKGRFQIALGAGWYEPEFITYGIPFLKARARMKQLEEALTIVKMLWTEDECTFQGEQYEIKDASCHPKPVQRPHPPIWLGTVIGGPVMLGLAGRFAQVVNFGNVSKKRPADFHEIKEKLGEVAIKNNRAKNTIKLSVTRLIIMRSSEKEAEEAAKKYSEHNHSVDDFRERVYIVGTPSQITEQIAEYLRAGIEYFVADFPDLAREEPDLSKPKIFTSKIIPALTSGSSR